MASVVKEIRVRCSATAAWDAIRDIGELHTRLVPGFVTDTKLEPGARIVTFANGVTVREPIVTLDEEQRRLVWSAVGGLSTHFNGAVQVFDDGVFARIVWISDFLPDNIKEGIEAAMTAGGAAMKRALDTAGE